MMSSVSGSESKPRWLDENEQRAWRAYVECVGDLFTAFENDLTEFGLTMGDYQVLVYLSEADDQALRMCDLARRLQLSPSGLTRRLDGMVKAGWVRRQNSQIDRRVMLAELTDAGRTALDDAAPGHVASVRRHLIDRLDRHQVQVMAEIFTAVGDGLRKESDVP
ncbi:MAG: MarR family transcriptional regulator [Acidimicrobiia bacterium]|jgi:DNA-binding MarR family transcriptional regulator|nr:MarR family transcriptional regulator [Acidimicrobiia bacterium]MBA3982327.1 MarR family transcriptional regulator [Acidimicrobiia bacterium]